MTMVYKNNTVKIFESLLVPFVLTAFQYFFQISIQKLGFDGLSAFIITGSLNLVFVYFICKRFHIKLNHSNVFFQLKVGLAVSGLGLLSLAIAHFVVSFLSDISIWDLFRGSKSVDLMTTHRLVYLFTIGVFGPFYEEFYYRGFTLSVLDKLNTQIKTHYYLGRSSAILAFVVMHVLFLGFSYWSIFIWAICGIITTVLYDYLKGFWAGFVVHGLANTVLVLLHWRLI